MVRAILMAAWLPFLVEAADFTVGSASAPSGQKATGYIAVPAGVEAASSIPVIVVNGARPGPVLALVAGSHGAVAEEGRHDRAYRGNWEVSAPGTVPNVVIAWLA
ncbi:MAG TPA: hypothetical protein VLW65_10740 [Bryobacteraceae bacterium]|nr:hypothetical protein [Bryobacteraceae bacterium]